MWTLLWHISVWENMQCAKKDEKIPMKYGVAVKETCGPGGIAYGNAFNRRNFGNP